MKYTLYTFTGTGNSIFIARILAEGLGDTEILPIPGSLRKGSFKPGGECVGFIIPGYYSFLPELPKEFMRKLDYSGVKEMFIVVHSGGFIPLSTGDALNTFKQTGKKLDGFYLVSTVGNYIPFEKDKTADQLIPVLRKTEQRVREILELIRSGNHLIEKQNAVYRAISWLLYPFMARVFLNNHREWDRKFFTDDSCNQCGICTKVCPVNNIVLTDNKPVWMHNCQQCYACIHNCPQSAIQLTNAKNHNFRYRNPEVTLKDILDQK